MATAGHCVYLHNQGGWARRIEVIPGCNGSARPFGQAVSSSLRSVVGWVSNKKPEYDFGCVVLPTGSFGGSNLGSFGFAAFDAAKLLAQAAVLAGYPGDKPFAELWGMARKIKTVAAKTLVYDIIRSVVKAVRRSTSSATANGTSSASTITAPQRVIRRPG